MEEPTCPTSAESTFDRERGVMRALCNVCLRSMPLRKDNTIRVHGPVGDRCPGSGSSPFPRDSPIDIPPRTDSQTSTENRADDFSTLPYVRILKRIPRASRDQSARKLATILDEVTADNSVSSWMRLLNFPRRCLRVPVRGGRRWNLGKHVNHQLSEESDPPPTVSLGSRKAKPSKGKHQKPLQLLAKRVSEKLEEGDFRGAVRLTCSEDTLANNSEDTIAALRSKHPPPHPDTAPSEVPRGSAVSVVEADVMQVIRSFPKSSAGGPDGLRPQHLQDMVDASAGAGGALLIQRSLELG